MSSPKLQSSRRIRATPYSTRVEALGVGDFSVVNHTILPKGFAPAVDEYWHLKSHAQLWDVGCQRQVELTGRDAARLAQLMTPRDLRSAEIGQCLYAPMIDENGGMLNDPVILKLAEDRFWFSIADSDVLLWAKGLAVGMHLDVHVNEPDVWPLAIQGPKAQSIARRVFGDELADIGFFRFAKMPFENDVVVVARTGFSKQGGFEIYPESSALGQRIWDALWEAGRHHNLAPGCPNLIERIEGGLLSYGNEMTREDNPFESGLARYCHVDADIEFIGKSALQAIAGKPVTRKIGGLIFDGEACPAPRKPWSINSNSVSAGYVTSAIWSPRFQNNVALAMLKRDYWEPGTPVIVDSADGKIRCGVVSNLPMKDDDGATLG
ncbi:MAG: dimethylsulfoniopropionate demethylase [Pseudomonadota bacterium]